VIDDEKANREARPERIHQRALPTRCARLGEDPFEHKHNGCSRHVAIVAQDGPRFNQPTMCKSEGVLDRRDHLSTTRVTDEAVDIVDRQAVTGEELRCNISELRGDEVGNVAGEDRLEAVIRDLPTHYVETLWPGMFAGGGDRRSLAIER